jgi:hypothetical protein
MIPTMRRFVKRERRGARQHVADYHDGAVKLVVGSPLQKTRAAE